jgi:hypothetical protein
MTLVKAFFFTGRFNVSSRTAPEREISISAMLETFICATLSRRGARM